jgi:hypothetical protein
VTRELRRRLRPGVLFLAIGAGLIGLASGSHAWAGDRDPAKHQGWNWSGTLASGRTLEIHGINGDIVAEPSPGDRVEVVADKSGRRHDPAEVRIEVNQDTDGVTICAVYPGQRSPCGERGSGWNSHDNDVRVDFMVRVPAGVTFAANTVNGAIRTRSLGGPVRASTVNGACDIETSRSGQATTVNGSVHAVLGRVGAGDVLAFSTVNGGITLRLPGDLDAEFSASTVNGAIHSQFPVTIASGWGPRSAHGTIGRGGARVTASTVNGAIQVEKLQSQ